MNMKVVFSLNIKSFLTFWLPSPATEQLARNAKDDWGLLPSDYLQMTLCIAS